MPASYETHRKQLELILQAWGMPEPTAASTAEIMSWADLHGIDTHGISMVPPYDERRRDGQDRHARRAEGREGDAGLGADRRRRRPRPSQRAARAWSSPSTRRRRPASASRRCATPAHFGACGFYALMAVEAGPDRHGHDVGERHPGRADQRRAGAARHRSDRLRRTRQARRAVPARHGDHDGGRRQDPQQGEREPADADRAGWSPRTACPAPIRRRSARAAS